MLNIDLDTVQDTDYTKLSKDDIFDLDFDIKTVCQLPNCVNSMLWNLKDLLLFCTLCKQENIHIKQLDGIADKVQELADNLKKLEVQ